jgi:hypothetical protein
MTHLDYNDFRHIVGRIPKKLIDIMKLNPKLVIGGGFIRALVAGEPVNDIDLFVESKAEGIRIAKVIVDTFVGSYQHNSENAITILNPPRTPIQIITRWTYDKVESIIESFDFTVCQAVLWNDAGKWKALCSDRFYRDLAAKRLTYTVPTRNEDAGGSILRMCKFLRRGYSMSPEDLAKVVARFVKGFKADIEVCSEEYIAIVMTGLLREVDPMKIIDGGTEYVAEPVQQQINGTTVITEECDYADDIRSQGSWLC